MRRLSRRLEMVERRMGQTDERALWQAIYQRMPAETAQLVRWIQGDITFEQLQDWYDANPIQASGFPRLTSGAEDPHERERAIAEVMQKLRQTKERLHNFAHAHMIQGERPELAER